MKTALLIMGMILSVQAYAWREAGNGGDHTAQEFVATAKEAIDILETISPPLTDKETIRKVRASLQTTQVFMVGELCLLDVNNGRRECFDALNYPKATTPRIEVSRTRWVQMNRKERLAIALHEFLGIIEVENNTYQISGPFREALGTALETRIQPVTKEELGKLENLNSGITNEEARTFCERETSINSESYFYVFCEFNIKNISKNSKIQKIPNYQYIGTRYSPDNNQHYYVYERINYNYYEPSERVLFVSIENFEESILSSVRIIGVGNLANLPYKTILNSLKLGSTPSQQQIALRFSDESIAYSECFKSLSARQNSQAYWNYDRAVCEVLREENTFFYLIRTQNPYAKEKI